MVILAYVLVTVKSGSERRVCERMSEYKEVLEVSEVYGEYDLILKVQVENLSQLDRLLTQRIRSNPNVLLTYTIIISKQHKTQK